MVSLRISAEALCASDEPDMVLAKIRSWEKARQLNCREFFLETNIQNEKNSLF
jgi:hypothetical protein